MGSVNEASLNNDKFNHYQSSSGHSSQAREFSSNYVENKLHLGRFSRYNGDDSQQWRRNRDYQDITVPLPPRAREGGHQKLEQEVNNMPTWMTKRGKTTLLVDKLTKPPAFLFSDISYIVSQSNHARPIPVNIDNGLPDVAMRFNVSDEKETSFNVHTDSCAGLNIGNLNVHKWVITTYPYIVNNYMDFYDKDKFEPLGFNCATNDVKDVENNVRKITAIVIYYTRYISIANLPIFLSFCLGKEVTINAIIGKPILKEWKGCVNFNIDIFTSKELMLQFDMEYKVVDTGLPTNLIFDSTGFVRPHATFSTGPHIVSITRGNNSATMHPESDVTAATISDTHMDGCFARFMTRV